jgi:hypothetical protein
MGLHTSAKCIAFFKIKVAFEFSSSEKILDNNYGNANNYFNLFIINYHNGVLMSDSYYKVIDGKKYDRSLLDSADKAIEGAGDGRISVDDAKQLFSEVADGNTYTEIEKDTMSYIRDNYNFTQAANEWLRTEIRSWAAKRGHANRD